MFFKRLEVLFAIALLTMMSSGCSQEKKNIEGENKYYHKDITGEVPYVHNIQPLWGDEKRVVLEPLLTIGSDEDTREDYMFSWIGDATIDSKGNYYILDSKENCIKVFDSQGIYIKTIGRFGQGPVEFNQPKTVCIGINEMMFVNEFRGHRLQRISLGIEPYQTKMNKDFGMVDDMLLLGDSSLTVCRTYCYSACFWNPPCEFLASHSHAPA